jgi:hypothetical protein
VTVCLTVKLSHVFLVSAESSVLCGKCVGSLFHVTTVAGHIPSNCLCNVLSPLFFPCCTSHRFSVLYKVVLNCVNSVGVICFFIVYGLNRVVRSDVINSDNFLR